MFVGIPSSSKLVQCQKPLQDQLIGRFGGVVGPVVGRPDGAVERRVQVGEPGEARIVEIGQGAFFELGFGRAFRVQPVGADLVELLGRPRDGVQPLIAPRLFPRRMVSDQKSNIGSARSVPDRQIDQASGG